MTDQTKHVIVVVTAWISLKSVNSEEHAKRLALDILPKLTEDDVFITAKTVKKTEDGEIDG